MAMVPPVSAVAAGEQAVSKSTKTKSKERKVVIDAVFPTISDKNPVRDQLMAQGLTQEVFAKLFISGEIKTWGEVIGDPAITDEVHVYTRSDACGAADTWAK